MKKFPGKIALIGSGETAPGSGQVFEILIKEFDDPLKISILETPAGFELNSRQVAQRVADFLQIRLQNFHPEIHVIPARRRGTEFSPDNEEILEPLKESSLLYMGAGSPSYAVRQLTGSLAWNVFQGRHRCGASLGFASAATVALGKWALPVYEIFKVGEDPHWKAGLDFFAPFGLNLVIVPHWNNQEGGSDLDTSRCFMGQKRFEILQSQLAGGETIIGLDEHTSLVLDFENQSCKVLGRESVHVMSGDEEKNFKRGSTFSICELGPFSIPEDLKAGIPAQAWKFVEKPEKMGVEDHSPLPKNIQELVQLRQTARTMSQWNRADELRNQITALGWDVIDTPQGTQLEKRKP